MSDDAGPFSPSSSKDKGACSSTCPTFPCQVCWKPQQQPCQQKAGDNFITMTIDVIGILIFFIFMMLQFWFKVATYMVRGVRAFYCADRVAQIALSVIAFLVLGSLLVHVFLGSRCYSRDKILLKRQLELELCRAGKFGKAGAAGVAGAAGTTGSAAVKKQEVVIRPLKITLQIPKNYKNIPLNATRIFTVMILDHKKKKIYESQQEVKIPEKERPPLVMAMQPIVINDYQ